MTETLMTAEEVIRLPTADKAVELVRGRLVVREPPGSCALKEIIGLR